MLRTWRWALVWSTSFALLGCPLMKKPGENADGGPAASASALVEAGPPAAAGPTNDSEVTHYPDQAAGNNETLTTRMTATARTEASSTGGKVVTTLKPGTATQKMADHEGFELVTFPDPSNAGQTLEGWVNHLDFGAAAPAPTHVDGGSAPPSPTPACKPQPLDVKKNANGSCNAGYASCGAMCRMSCKADADCCLSTAHCTGGYCLGPGASPCGH